MPFRLTPEYFENLSAEARSLPLVKRTADTAGLQTQDLNQMADEALGDPFRQKMGAQFGNTDSALERLSAEWGRWRQEAQSLRDKIRSLIQLRYGVLVGWALGGLSGLSLVLAHGLLTSWAGFRFAEVSYGLLAAGGVLLGGVLARQGLASRARSTGTAARRAEGEAQRLEGILTQETENLDKAILDLASEELLGHVAEELAPYFEFELPEARFEALADIGHEDLTVPTPVADELDNLLERLSGATIGLAGPRGAGKTTLLSRFRSQRALRGSRKQLLYVYTPVPVHYAVREFLLHLFSQLCRAVLLHFRDSPRHGPWRRRLLRRSDPLASYDSTPSLSYPSLLQRLLGVKVAVLFLLVGVAAVSLSVRAIGVVEPADGAIESLILTLARLGFDSPKLFAVGALGALLGAVRLIGAFLERRRLRNRPVLDPWLEENRPEPQDLATRARMWLDRLQFQLSYSSGWSGSLSLPGGAESSASGVTVLAQQQLTVPDVVKAFCDFVEALSHEFDVVISIDELDKMQKDSALQEFLNGIKALFQTKRCFYLLSVSRNAIRSFQKRGLPVRDVLDSTFDTIIDMGVVDYSTAEKLLRRRLGRVPRPFLVVVYCLSGGVARDIIRYSREFLTHGEDAGKQFGDATEVLLLTDIRRRVFGVCEDLEAVTGPADSAWLTSHLRNLLSGRIDLANLDAADTELCSLTEREVGDLPAGIAESSNAFAVVRQGLMLAAYVAFASSLAKLMTPSSATLLAEGDVQLASQLAEARMLLETNSQSCREALVRFRRDAGIVPLEVSSEASIWSALRSRTGAGADQRSMHADPGDCPERKALTDDQAKSDDSGRSGPN